MKELLEDIKLSKISYLVEKLEKNNFNDKIKAFRKLEKYKITKKIGLYLIENSTRNFDVVDEFGGINSSLIELCFKNYYVEYNDAIRKVFKDLTPEAQDRVLYLLTTLNEKESLILYSDLVLKYYKNRVNIPIGELSNKPLSYPYIFPKLYKALKFDIEKNNILILLNNYLNSGVVLKEDIKKNKKIITDYICSLFEKALTYKFKNTYDGLHNKEYKELRYFLELAVNIEYYISGKKTKEYLEKLLKKNDNQLKLFILDNYFRKNKKLNKFNFDPIVKDKSSRYALFELLTIYEKVDLMPKKYLTQKLLSESDLYTNFVIATSYTNEPKNLKFIKKYTKDKYDYYVYQFNYKYLYNNNTNDYLTNYISNQIGMNKYNGEEVNDKYIGISGGYNKDKEISIIEKNHKKLLIKKLDSDNIDKIIEELINTKEEEIKVNKNETKNNKINSLISKIKLKKDRPKKEKPKKERIKKEKVKKEKLKKEKKKLFNFKKKENNIKENIQEDIYIVINKKNYLFSYVLLFLFAVFLGLLIYCMLYIYGIGSINDGIDEKTIKPVKLDDKGNFTEIMATEIFNQTENEYFVLLFRDSKKEKTKYYRYINEYNKRNFRFYYVDLTNNENKFLYGPNDLDFIVYTDRLLHVKDKEYEYYVDGKTNILNEMQTQIEEIMQKEKEEKKSAMQEEKKQKVESIVISMTDNKKDEKPITKVISKTIKKENELNKYALKYSKIDFKIKSISVPKNEFKDNSKPKIIVKNDNKNKKNNIDKLKDIIVKSKANIYELKSFKELSLR